MKTRFLLTIICLLIIAIVYVSCGPTVKIDTPDKPIEINVNVRIDIYNHVASVEESIYGDVNEPEENRKPSTGNESFLRGFFMQGAFGAVSVEEYNAALERRKARARKVIQYKDDGSLGENHEGLVSLIQNEKVRNDDNYAKSVKNLIKDENSDREKMYEYDASKKGVPVSVIKESSAQYHRDSAKKGWWIEVKEEGKWVWKQK